MSKPSKLKLALLTLAAIAASAPAWAGDYKYWYDDPDFGHQAGDLTNGNAAIVAPAWACARRFFSGVELQWIGEFGAGIAPNNGGQEISNSINVHFGTGPGCQARPRMENHPAKTLIPPRHGTHWVVIDPDAGSYWVNKDGGWPACNCAAPVGFKALSLDIRWSALDRVFSVQFDRTAPDTGKARTINIQALSGPLSELQRSVASEVSKRRLQLVPTIETAVRQLEDLALTSLSKAATLVEQCRVSQDQGASGEAYKACDRARRSVLMAQHAMKTVVEEMH